jgi:hypothetical protein
MSTINRKKFIYSSAVSLISVPFLLQGQQSSINTKPYKGAPLDKELVKEFVSVAHKDFDKLKIMLQEKPDLLNAVHNLGGWDWEDAIGAAGHVGNREMASFLLEQGARPTICVAAMLGQLAVVTSYIEAFPQMKNAVGPHRISLLRHAKAGGEPAAKVVEYLLAAGAS